MPTLEAPQALWLLPLPVLVWLFFPRHRAPIEAVRVPFFSQLVRLTGADPRPGSVVLRRPWIRGALLAAVWISLVLALSRPVLLAPPRTIERSARDLLVAVDLSASMDLRDLRDERGELVRRVDAVKRVLDDFVARRRGDRIGLIVFGEAPFLQAPFTQDVALIRELLRESDTGMAGEQTVIGDAIGLSLRVFERSEASQRTLILLTDGNDTGSLVPPLQAAFMARQAGVKLYLVGVGDPKTAGEQPLNEGLLRAMAKETGGRFYFAADRKQLESIYTDLDKLEKVTFESRTYQPRRSLLHWPLGVAVALILLFLGLSWLRSWLAARRAAGGGSSVPPPPDHPREVQRVG